MPTIYASPEQFMRDRSEYARKGIARGRSVVVTFFEGGVLFVAENHSPALHKVSEIYDRIGFAAAGRYNEFENLRTAGIRLADVRGFSYDRKDVTGRWLANAYAQTIGSIFSEHQKPFEVEICVAEVGPPRPPRPHGPGPADGTADGEAGTGDQLYRISYDGSIVEERKFVVMGGVNEPVTTSLTASFRAGWDLSTALRSAVSALGSTGDNPPRQLLPTQLEVAVLDRSAVGRTFRRIQGALLATLLAPPTAQAATDESAEQPVEGPVPESPEEI
ncbi:MAG TPA: proteasome subunit alpha [Nakamurella sp.]